MLGRRIDEADHAAAAQAVQEVAGRLPAGPVGGALSALLLIAGEVAASGTPTGDPVLDWAYGVAIGTYVAGTVVGLRAWWWLRRHRRTRKTPAV